MIWTMKQRVFGLCALLGVAVAATSHPALAQEPDSWFDDSATDAPSSPAPAAPPADAAPEMAQSVPSAPPNAPPGPSSGPSETDPRVLTEFRPTLDPYGSWVEDPTYGTVWVPSRAAVGPDFAPYVSAGHWALTDDGDWIWQSDYPFGGVVFHYGRWVWLPGTGWAWVAGSRYANAWVTWRVADSDYGYIGWAPMAPAWGWYGGSAIALAWYPPTPYVFCPSRYAFSYGVHAYIVHDRYLVRDVAAHTRPYTDGRNHIAASPRVLPANSVAPRGPSLQSAHIPASVVPAARVPSAHLAAVSGRGVVGGTSSLSRPSSAAPRFDANSGRFTSYSNPSSYARPRPRSSVTLGSSYQYAPAARSSAQPAYRSSPSFSASQPYRPAGSANTAPVYRPAGPVNAAPVYRAAPAFRSTPSYRPSPSFNSAPAYRAAPSTPSFNAPTYRAAPQTHSAPTFHSAPSFHSAPAARSAPSFHPAPSFHSPSRR